jgi:CubicO group peptidase (beta-lactamase class C family)
MIEGHFDTAFEPLVLAFRRSVSGTGRGGALAVYLRGRPVVDVWAGDRDREYRWLRDTPCVAYSTTKGVASTALHLLADRGLLDYDAPIARYWPGFARNGKSTITVRDLMSHRAGMYDVRRLVDHARDLLDWDGMVDRIERAPPMHRGPSSSYHGITYGYLAGAIVETITGAKLQAFVESEIARPLGLDHFYVQTPIEARRVAARLFVNPRGAERDFPPRWFRPPIPFAEALLPPGMYDFDVSRDEVMAACIPSSNGVFSARALAKFYSVLANDGEDLISRRTMARAIEQQVHGRDRVLWVNAEWRLGFHRVHTVGRKPPLRGFGHNGYGGSGAWAEPDRRLSFAMVRNFGMGSPLGDYTLFKLSALALQCAQ